MENSIAALLGAIAAVESPLKFWAFIAVVFLALAVAFFRSTALHKTWAKVVGEDLAKSHRFRIVRLVSVGMLCIAILALILAFLAPLALRKMEIEEQAVQLNATLATYAVMLDGNESESVQQDFASAMSAFKSQDYITARRRMLSLQRQVVSKQSQEMIQGLITATFYARSEHIEGLKFICDQYRDKPKWDARFRYQIHAHVRRIAINEGYEDAEKVVASLRPGCRRGDLSPVWAGIPLGGIERLVAAGRHTLPDLDAPDEAFLRYVLERFPRDAMLDHALLFLDEDEELLRRFPESTLTLAALERIARRKQQSGENELAVQFGERYLAQLSKSPSPLGLTARTESVVETLGSAYLALGRFDDARKLDAYRDPAAEGVPGFVYAFARAEMEKLKEAQDLATAIDKSAEAGYPPVKVADLLPDVPPGIVDRLRQGEFSEAASDSKLATSILKARKVTVPPRWVAVEADIVRLANRADALSTAELLQAGLDMREQANKDDVEWEMVPVIRATGMGLWKRCIDRDPQSVNAMKSAYLRGAALRRHGDFRDAAAEFTALIAHHAGGELTDDALAELVSYNVDVLDDAGAAKPYADRLVAEFPQGNAVDNALYILGNFHRYRREYAEAAHYYSAVAMNYGERRLAAVSREYVDALEQTIASKKQRLGVVGLRFFADGDDEAPATEPYVDEVEKGSAAATAGLLVGDLVKAVSSREISTVAQFYQALGNSAPGAEVDVTVVRGFDEKLVALHVVVAPETYYAKSLVVQH